MGVRDWVVHVGRGLVVASYPITVYLGLRYGHGRVVIALLAALTLASLAYRLRSRQRDATVLLPPLLVMLLLVVSWVWGDNTLLLALPVVVNVVLLVAFGRTLMLKTSMVERYARLIEPNLSDDRRAHCRQITWVWVCFFAANATVTAAVAGFGSVELWALHTGILSYVAMGVLFAGEWWLRERRFPGSARMMWTRLRRASGHSKAGATTEGATAASAKVENEAAQESVV